MTVGLLYAWMMVLLRSIGLVMQLPVLAGHPIPVMVRLAISIGIASLLAGLVHVAPLPMSLWALIGASTLEMVLGFGIGFMVRLSFAAVEMAGRMISTEVGMTASPGLGAPEPSHEPVAALLSAMATVLFFMLGAHHAVLIAFAKTFQIAPAGGVSIGASAANTMIQGTAHMIELAVRIAAPFIAMNFLVNLAFSVLGRAVPKMNVFVVSFSARALFGLALLSTAGGLIARYMYVEFGDLPVQMLRVLRAG